MTLGTAERGCLMFADITGYTKYIGGTELTHAQDVVADLIETIVGSIEPRFRLSKLEGDAAFCYAPQADVTPSMMMDTVEATYFAFQRRVRDIAHATSCPCDACIRIPSLDLKFFLHEGEYVVRRIARSEELTGLDVVLLHRLSKGTAGSKVSESAYAVYTKATTDALGMDPATFGLVPHSETYDDVGDVPVFVQDLWVLWEEEQERNRDFVTEDEAVLMRSFDTPARPQMVWEHITDPEKRMGWQRHVTGLIPMTEGRSGIGTVNHCMHGEDVTVEHVVDWTPFSYITLHYDTMGVEDWRWTHRIEAIPEGTRFTMLLADPGGDHWARLEDGISNLLSDVAGYLEEMLREAHAATGAGAVEA